MNRARALLEREGHTVTNADIQALLWYPEKDIYAKLDSRPSEGLNMNYAQAWRDLAAKKGVRRSCELVHIRHQSGHGIPLPTTTACCGRALGDFGCARSVCVPLPPLWSRLASEYGTPRPAHVSSPLR